MHRVDTPGAVANRFNDGNPAIGQQATQLASAWCNDVQENLCKAIEGAGIALVKGNETQLLDAIRLLSQLGGVKPGQLGYWALASAPTGWLKANGAAVSRTTYAGLFAAIGTTYGVGDGATTFNLPDARGEFARGLDDGRGVDAGRTLGSWQPGSHLPHDNNSDAVHVFGDRAGAIAAGWEDPAGLAATITSVLTGTGVTTSGIPLNDSAYFSVSRPRNIAWLACIKF